MGIFFLSFCFPVKIIHCEASTKILRERRKKKFNQGKNFHSHISSVSINCIGLYLPHHLVGLDNEINRCQYLNIETDMLICIIFIRIPRHVQRAHAYWMLSAEIHEVLDGGRGRGMHVKEKRNGKKKFNPNTKVGIRNKDSVPVEEWFCFLLPACSILPVSVTPAVFMLCNRASLVSNYLRCMIFSFFILCFLLIVSQVFFFLCPRLIFVAN